MELQVINPRKIKSQVILSLAVLFFSIYRLYKRDFSQVNTSSFEKFMVNITSPAQEALHDSQGFFHKLYNHYIFLVDASFENIELKKKIKELENHVFQLSELQRENLRLKRLLDFNEATQYQKILAQVIALDSSRAFKMIRVNKGSADGLKLKATVATNEGLVGHVYRLGRHYADILTILDRNNRVDALIVDSRAQGIVEGLSDQVIIMKYVERTESVKLFQEVITAGLSRIYPKGLKIGTITAIEKESYGITQLIEVTPSVNFSKLEEVIIFIEQNNHTKKVR